MGIRPINIRQSNKIYSRPVLYPDLPGPGDGPLPGGSVVYKKNPSHGNADWFAFVLVLVFVLALLHRPYPLVRPLSPTRAFLRPCDLFIAEGFMLSSCPLDLFKVLIRFSSSMSRLIFFPRSFDPRSST
ncbi:uncharacterized protein BO96DRAFT_163186 [Aspergillus niger CBS 101883]|uniref:Uncharacterized protein n=1 Tax=Aspergillus niger ATCC 13496 TaxID=1353008 RepID=A0A370C0Y7_ASPNG|nr:uncharacterized protein BO96DRAFT_163186 [Aspergillus niger CBS 101883]PYH52491.1 hypothetical protein BO96DRAFT_163186 [Aspergillus niger CBS 101883]RDH19322.1 hypothetical protein M747DRAFT_61715 [Aspergillus niger ATCC 13496]